MNTLVSRFIPYGLIIGLLLTTLACERKTPTPIPVPKVQTQATNNSVKTEPKANVADAQQKVTVAKSQVNTDPVGPSAPPPGDEPKKTFDPEEVEKAYSPLLIMYKTIPTSFKGMKGERLAAVTQNVKTTRDKLRAFLKAFPGTPQACQASLQLAQLNLYLRSVIQHDLRQSAKLKPDQVNKLMLHHYGDTVTLIKDFLKCAPKTDSKRAEALQKMGDAFYYAGQIEGAEQFKLAFESYKKIIDNYPNYKDRKRVLLSSGHSLVELRDISRGLPLMQEAIKADPNSDYLPFYYQMMWKLRLSEGNLNEMKKLTHEFLKLGIEKVEKKKFDTPELKTERLSWLRYIAFNSFRTGYVEFGLGNHAAAGQEFSKGLARFAWLAKQLGVTEKELPQEYIVYRNRILANQKFINTYLGQKPKVDLDAIHWVTGKGPTLAGSIGKPTVVMVRGYDVKREQEFLKSVDSFVAKNPDICNLIVLSWMKGRATPVGIQAGKALNEMHELGLTHTSVGLTTTPRPKEIYELGTTIGSGSLVMFDKNGNFEFFMQDLRTIDDNFVISIIKRIAEQK